MIFCRRGLGNFSLSQKNFLHHATIFRHFDDIFENIQVPKLCNLLAEKKKLTKSTPRLLHPHLIPCSHLSSCGTLPPPPPWATLEYPPLQAALILQARSTRGVKCRLLFKKVHPPPDGRHHCRLRYSACPGPQGTMGTKTAIVKGKIWLGKQTPGLKADPPAGG